MSLDGRAESVDRAVGSLLGVVVGDSAAAPFEGAARATTWDEGRARLAGVLRRPVLHHTDDTEMTLALAGALVDADDAAAVDAHALGQRYRRRHDAAPDRGYGRGTVGVLRALATGPAERAPFAVFPDGSRGNGAAMRVAPVALRFPGPFGEPTRAAVASRDAAVTHAHADGIAGAVLQAEAVAHAAWTGTFGPDFLDLVRSHDLAPRMAAQLDELDQHLDALPRSPRVFSHLAGEATAIGSVPLAWWLAMTAGDAATLLARACALGRDADTVAAMAGAIHGAVHGERAWELAWLSACEPDAVGAARDLARSLADPTG